MPYSDVLCDCVAAQVLGPRHSGKTSLLQKAWLQRTSSGSSSGSGSGSSEPGQPSQPSGPICYVNCRTIDAASPSGLARALATYVLPPLLADLGNSSVDGLDLGYSLLTAAMQPYPKASPIAELKLPAVLLAAMLLKLDSQADVTQGSVLAALLEVLIQREVQRRPGVPVMVIDEAHVLMEWPEGSQAALAALVRFLLHLTKEGRRCHVLLATSEPAFARWVTKSEWLAACCLQSRWVPAAVPCLVISG